MEGIFSCLPMLRESPNASRLTTEYHHTEDRSAQSNSELKLAGPVKRKMSGHQSTNECDSVESNISQEDVYIQIPLSVMSVKESTSNKSKLISIEGQNVIINYNLIEGFPSYAKEKIRKRKSYVMSYDTETKNAEWVYEILNESTLKNTCKEHMSFGKNELENRYYQQGHLAAAANHRWCQEAYHDTYLMSNMIPQLSDSNQKMWKTLEDYCRELAKPGCNVHVYTGPLYLCKIVTDEYVRVLDPETLEKRRESKEREKKVPTHLFKVIIVEKNGRVEEPKCYVMPNEKSEYNKLCKSAEKDSYSSNKNKCDLLDYFEKSIEEIEKWSGLKFKIDKPQYNMIEHTEPITWKGEDRNGESCEAKIEVKILNINPCSDNKDANV